MRLRPGRQFAGLVAIAGVLVVIVLVIGARDSPERPTVVTWKPLTRPVREADTLFLPDLGSARAINRAGGFLDGDETVPQRDLARNFRFGPGRFGPAVRPIPGRGDFVFFPVDGLLDGREFTLEFWARSSRPWSAIATGKATLSVVGGFGGNRLQILAPYAGQCAVSLGALESVPARASTKTWQAPCDRLGLTARRWHHVAVTLARATLRVYIDGRQVGAIGGVRFLPLWSDTTKDEGIRIGGEPGVSDDVWVSDVRASRTARIPGHPVRLRPLTGSVAVDAGRVAGTVPPRFVASLKIKPITPSQARAGLDGIREGDTLTATPIKRGAPDETHPSAGHSGKFSYDWQVVDRSFDWLRARGLDGYIDADSTPQILGGSVPPNPRTPFFGGTYANAVPNDLDAWATIVGDLVRHVRQRGYAVRRWTVWNEPDLGAAFWQGTREQYLKMYVLTARAIKAADPGAQVGGPELARLDPEWIAALFERARRDHAPLDFFSFHDYSGDLNTLTQARAMVDHYAARAGFRTPFPIAVGEFNWSDRNEHGSSVAAFRNDYWHVRAFNAAYTTAALINAVRLGGFTSFVWAHTGGIHGPIRDGQKYATMQLIGDHGEQWAPFNALVGWKRTVGRERLATREDLPPGVYSLASKDPATGRLGLVFANYGWAQREAREVSVRLTNVPRGTYRVDTSLVDRAHSSRWDVAEDRPEGARENNLETVKRRTMKVTGPVRLALRLPAWSSTFVSIQPV